MQEAVGLHRAGRLHEAEKIYVRVVKAAPDYFDALHLLGSLKAQAGQMGEALRLITAALKINPRATDALINLANVMHALKRDADAHFVQSNRRYIETCIARTRGAAVAGCANPN